MRITATLYKLRARLNRVRLANAALHLVRVVLHSAERTARYARNRQSRVFSAKGGEAETKGAHPTKGAGA